MSPCFVSMSLSGCPVQAVDAEARGQKLANLRQPKSKPGNKSFRVPGCIPSVGTQVLTSSPPERLKLRVVLGAEGQLLSMTGSWGVEFKPPGTTPPVI